MKKEYIRSLAVIVGICLAMGLLLAVVYQITHPIIVENERIKTEEAMKAMFPDVAEFTPVFEKGERPADAPKTLLSLYKTDGGDYVATVETTTSYGKSTFMVGIDTDLKQVVAVKKITYADSVDVGEEYISSFAGQGEDLPDVMSSASPAKYTRLAIANAVQDVFRYVAVLSTLSE